MPENPIITLTTDFGIADSYVGAMKGVILGIAPRAAVVDITHEVPPQAVEAGAFLLGDAWRFFPRGTIHVAVVDPGVGTARRAIAVETPDGFGVGPDNGVLSPLLEAATRVVELQEARWFRPVVSATFHGRDIFAPVAAHLATGESLDHFGPAVVDAIRLVPREARIDGDTLVGEVIHVDRFGNLVTTITAPNLTGWKGVQVEIAGWSIPALAMTYGGDVAGSAGADLRALIGSSGRLEIAAAGGSAARVTGASRGARVIVRRSANG